MKNKLLLLQLELILTSKSLTIFTNEFVFINQIVVNADFGMAVPEIDSFTTKVSANSKFGLISPKIDINSGTIPVTAKTTSPVAFGVSQANATITYNNIIPQVSVYVSDMSSAVVVGSFDPIIKATNISVDATAGYGSTYENIQIIVPSVSTTSSIGLLVAQENVVVPATSAETSTTSLSAFSIGQANAASIALNITDFNISVISSSALAHALATFLPSQAQQGQPQDQVLATIDIGSTSYRIDVNSPIVSGSATIGSFYEYGLSSANATLVASPLTTLIGQSVDAPSTNCSVTVEPLSTFLMSEDASIIPAMATVDSGLLDPQVNIVSSSIFATATTTTVVSLISPSISEIDTIISVDNVMIEIDASSVGAVSTADAKAIISSLISPIQIPDSGASVVNPVSPQINYIASQASATTAAGAIARKFDMPAVKAFILASATTPSSSIFVQALGRASASATTTNIVPTLIISATASVSTFK